MKIWIIYQGVVDQQQTTMCRCGIKLKNFVVF